MIHDSLDELVEGLEVLDKFKSFHETLFRLIYTVKFERQFISHDASTLEFNKKSFRSYTHFDASVNIRNWRPSLI